MDEHRKIYRSRAPRPASRPCRRPAPDRRAPRRAPRLEEERVLEGQRAERRAQLTTRKWMFATRMHALIGDRDAAALAAADDGERACLKSSSFSRVRRSVPVQYMARW